MSTILTANGVHCPERATVPDDVPADELDREMYLFACEASAWDAAHAFGKGGEAVTVRAWHHDAFRVSDMTERTYSVPPLLRSGEIKELIAGDYR